MVRPDRPDGVKNHFENLIVNFIKGLFHVFNILDQASKECGTYQGPDKFQKWRNKVHQGKRIMVMRPDYRQLLIVTQNYLRLLAFPNYL